MQIIEAALRRRRPTNIAVFRAIQRKTMRETFDTYVTRTASRFSLVLAFDAHRLNGSAHNGCGNRKASVGTPSNEENLATKFLA
jgi:hypothetical protein